MNVEKLSAVLRKIKFVRFAIACVVLNVAVFMIFVLPDKAKYQALQADYQRLKTEVEHAQKQEMELQVRYTKLIQAQKDLKEIYENVLESKRSGPTEIRLELEGLAQNMQIKRSDFNYEYEELPDYHLQRFILGVPVEGNYRSIRRFINSIERSKHFLILDRVDLSAEKSQSDLLNLNFKLSTYLVENAI